MNPLDHLASALGRRDEEPNVALAVKLADAEDHEAITILADALTQKSKPIQSDSIKVLYEIGDRKPRLIEPYISEFVQCLQSKNQRLVWGGMTALHAIAKVNPAAINKELPHVLRAANGESVIARDHAVGILIELSRHKELVVITVPLLLEQLSSAPDNQFAMYAEQSLQVLFPAYAKEYNQILNARIKTLPKPSQAARIAKLLRKTQPSSR